MQSVVSLMGFKLVYAAVSKCVIDDNDVDVVLNGQLRSRYSANIGCGKTSKFFEKRWCIVKRLPIAEKR